MKHRNLKTSFRLPLQIVFFLVISQLSDGLCLAEITTNQVIEHLTKRAGFTVEELSQIEKGEMIAKLLPSEDKREVAVCGVIQLNAPLDVALKSFQDTMARQNKKSVMEFGSFSPLPIIEDLRDLSLEQKDIEDIKNCKIGNCKVKLSAEMIGRFQKEIDWASDDYSAQANLLFRQIIVEYAKNYLLQGDAALLEFRDGRDVTSLQKEQKSLLERLLWLDEFAPQFLKYLQNFPRVELPNVRRSIGWAKLKFGLKPVVILTQTLTFTDTSQNNVSQILSISKQIYASRYFDSSLGLTALVKVRTNETDAGSYLIYENHTRSSSLDGAMSGLKHRIVEREAIEKLKPLLSGAKSLSEREPTNANDSAISEANGRTIPEWLAEQSYAVLFGISFGVLILGLGIVRLIKNSFRN